MGYVVVVEMVVVVGGRGGVVVWEVGRDVRPACRHPKRLFCKGLVIFSVRQAGIYLRITGKCECVCRCLVRTSLALTSFMPRARLAHASLMPRTSLPPASSMPHPSLAHASLARRRRGLSPM